MHHYHIALFFFFNDTATTEIYTLSLHDALPIFSRYRPLKIAPLKTSSSTAGPKMMTTITIAGMAAAGLSDRKSTRLNSSHANISYAVFCLKKKKINKFC